MYNHFAGPTRGSASAFLGIGNTADWEEYLFGLLNASEGTAIIVTLSPISDGNMIYRFDPIPSLVKSPAFTYLVYRATTLAGTPIGHHNTDMVRVLGIGKALGTVQLYETKLEFSNYGGESRWQVDYSLRVDFDAGSIACIPGTCRRFVEEESSFAKLLELLDPKYQ